MGAAVRKKSRRRNAPARAETAGDRKSARARRDGKLSRERIAGAAMKLVDRDGLDALSFRNLGAELGCEAMSIYPVFQN